MSTASKHHQSKEINSAIKLLGDSWVLCIVSSLAAGELRFCQIQRAVDGINPATLANRLKKLEQQHIISRKEETQDKLSVVYELTNKGEGILPTIREIGTFAKKFL